MSDLDEAIKKLDNLNENTREEIASALLKTYYLNDFYLFAKYFIGYKDLDENVHGQFIQVFESDAPRKIVVMPRGSFKSSLGSVAYPIWRLLRNPNLTILIDSEIYTNSKNFLREIKGHLESERMTKLFGEQRGFKWDEGEIILKTRTQNKKEASVTVSGIGAVKVGQHYDLCIGDDYNSPQNSESVEKCQKVIDHVRYNLNILNPGGEYLFIGTRYAERDVLGFLFSDVLGEKHLAEGKLKLSDQLINKDV